MLYRFMLHIPVKCHLPAVPAHGWKRGQQSCMCDGCKKELGLWEVQVLFSGPGKKKRCENRKYTGMHI